MKCRTHSVYNARARMLENARAIEIQIGSVHCWKLYSLDRSSTHAYTPSCSNLWCFAVHRTGKRIAGKLEYALSKYSGTSHNGPSERRTHTLQRTLAVLRIENTIAAIH